MYRKITVIYDKIFLQAADTIIVLYIENCKNEKKDFFGYRIELSDDI